MYDNRFSKFTLQQILEKTKYTKRSTKIICTVGPSCWEVDQLVRMIKTGMDVARLNFSHGDHEAHGQVVERILEAEKFCSACHCPIMLDTKGPEIRTGFLENKKITLQKDQELIITQDYSFIGNEQKIACSYAALSASVKIDDQILIADGSLVCQVTEILEEGVRVRVLNSATIGERKNMNLPGVKVDLPTVTEKDKNDIVNFALKYPVKLIALSFTRSAKDIETVRELLGEKGEHIKIIAKIENQEGLNNYDEILSAADGIMVARGDLGMEIPAQKVFVAQKWMIKKANLKGKPVITATQMMESMVKNPRPTRAEASDVANAVLDGTFAVMLSGETAGGDYPFDAVQIMSQICSEAELCFDNENMYQSLLREKQLQSEVDDVEAIASAAVQLSFDVNAKVIIAFTESGLMVRMVAKYFPKACIFAVGFFEKYLKTLGLLRGVRALKTPETCDSFIIKHILMNYNFFKAIDELLKYAIEFGKEMNRIKEGDRVIIVEAFTSIRQDNPLNMLKIQTI